MLTLTIRNLANICLTYIFLFHLKYDIFRWSIKATLFCHTNFFQKTLTFCSYIYNAFKRNKSIFVY